MRFVNPFSLLFWMVLSLAGFIPAHAATNLSADDYDIYIGDIDGDGDDDLYLHAKEKILLIASDITVPIPFRDEESLVLDVVTGEIQPWLAEVNLDNMTLVDMDILVGDFDGDGLADLFLKSNSSSYDSYVLYGDSGDSVSRVVSYEAIEGQYLFSSTVVVKDINNDGKDDLVIETSENQSVIALAEAGGAFNSAPFYQTNLNPEGAIAGDYSVGHDGSANYTIPIAVPVGGAGMQPSLAFSYNSGAGNGYMGMGWSVTQTSSIAKCSTTYIDDGYIEADKYWCLDGQRLIDVSSSFSKPADTMFYTQHTDFSKIEIDSSGTGFKVSYKSGEYAYFGNYNGLYPNAYDEHMDVHYLAKIEDRAGNARTYTYYKNATTGEHYLTHIYYPGGEVEYKYSNYTAGATDEERRNSNERVDLVESWYDGKKTQILKRLERVESKVSGSIYRAYNLTYTESPTGERTRLSEIEECATNSICIKPTTFDWSELSQVGFRESPNESELFFASEWQQGPQFIDMNGDGLTDMLLAVDDVYKLRLNTGDGRFSDPISSSVSSRNVESYAQPIDIDSDGKIELLIPRGNGWDLLSYDGAELTSRKTVISNDIDEYKRTPLIGDFDGNGLADVLVQYGQIESTTGHLYMNYSGSDFEFEGVISGYEDCELSGINCNWEALSSPPVVDTSGGDHVVRVCSPLFDECITEESRSPRYVVDLNGDGKQTILFPKDNVWRSLEFNFEGAQIEMSSRSVGLEVVLSDNGAIDITTKLMISEINGDGLPDVIYDKNGQWAVAINNGGFFSSPITTSIVFSSDAQLIDYDDDGRSDLVNVKDGNWVVYLFTDIKRCEENGADCYLEIDTGVEYSGQDNFFRVLELDGDGLNDLLTMTATVRVEFPDGTTASDWLWKAFLRAGLDDQLPTYLSKVVNGYGLETNFEYGQLYDDPVENGDFYNRGDDIEFPLLNMSGPIRVVKSVHLIKNGLDASDQNVFKDTVGYAYEQRVVHQQGLGSLGFKKVTSTSSHTRTETLYNHNWQSRLQGPVERQTVYKRETGSSEWHKVSESEFDYNILSDQGVYYTYLKGQTERTWVLGNTDVSSEPDPYKTVHTQYVPDIEGLEFELGQHFGDIKTIVVTTSSDLTDSSKNEVLTVSTVNEYIAPDTANWILGRLDNTTVTSTGTGREDVVRSSKWVYNEDGYIESETIEPGTALEQTISYTYNGLGLKESVTKSGPNVSSRSTTTKYDSLGRYPISVTTSLGSVSSSYDPLLGLVTSIKDVNGLTSFTRYDAFGRAVVKIKPDGTYTTNELTVADGQAGSSRYYKRYEENGNYGVTDSFNLSASYMAVTRDQNGAWSKTYFDPVGKAFETHRLNGFYESGTEVTVTRKEFDRYGKVLRESEPYASTGSAQYWTTQGDLDALQRPRRIYNQQGNVATIRYATLEKNDN